MDTVNCLKCSKRHPDNGNCTASGGFCTAVQAAHCQLLEEYLDTGKTPYEVNCLSQFAMGKMVAQIKEFDGVSVDRLRELAKADKAGRVAILPCEVGDTLWIAGSVRGLYSAKVRTFFCGHPSAERGTDDDGGVQMIRTTECDIPIGNFGKTVFLTREEAEAALHGFGGHPDPVGLKGQMAECPVCGGMCDWAPETDISTCRVCGYTNGKEDIT